MGDDKPSPLPLFECCDRKDCMRYYRLEGKRPVEIANDLEEWAKSYEASHRVVAQDWVGNVRVSTVFLGVDHNFTGGPPLIFETMIFGGAQDRYQKRYSTWDEAWEGHQAALTVVEHFK